MGVSSPRSLPHKLPPALTVVASLDHLIHLQICPLFHVIHITDSWPPPASPPFYLSSFFSSLILSSSSPILLLLSGSGVPSSLHLIPLGPGSRLETGNLYRQSHPHSSPVVRHHHRLISHLVELFITFFRPTSSLHHPTCLTPPNYHGDTHHTKRIVFLPHFSLTLP